MMTPARHRLVARVRHRAAAVVGAVARDVDDAAAAAKRAFGNSVMAWSIAPLIEVPPPNNCRGAARSRPRRLTARSSSISVQGTDLHLHRRPGPLHHRDGDGLRRAGADRAAAPADGGTRRRSPALQLEAVLVDAAGGIDREHELQVDRGLRRRGQGRGGRAATSSAASVYLSRLTRAQRRGAPRRCLRPYAGS